MKIVRKYMTNNPCYKAGKTIKVKGLMLHSVGCPQPRASVFINQMNKASYSRACVHAFIDALDGVVYQTLPWNMRGWHGGGKSNDTHIGVEMCEPAEIKYTSGSKFTVSDKVKARAATKRTYDSAVELFAYLCKLYNLNPLTDICSHKEGYRKGIASNHGDCEHLWDGLDMPYTMDGFRKDVLKAMGGNVANKQPVSQTTGSYRVRITADALNIRAGAGTSYKINGCIRDKGIYTIVETKGNWGKLKSGAGWISLSYCKKI